MRRLLPLLVLLPSAAVSAPFQNVAALEARVIGALGAGIGEVGGPAAPIDRRLKLAQCPDTVAIDPPAMGAVALRCDPLGWRIRVPLRRLDGAGATPGTAAASSAQAVIKRGDPVELVAERAGFYVSTQTVAQEDGAPGGRIRLKADAKSPVVIAEVVDMGRARIP